MRLLVLVALGLVVACSPTPAPPGQPVAQPLDIPPMAPQTAPKQAPQPPTAATDPGSSDDFDAARDPIAKRPKRPLALLVAENQQLDSLLNATPTTAPDRPALLKRTAEALLELAHQKDGNDAKAVRTKALMHFNEIATNAPKYPQLDEVYYFIGLTSEQNGELTNARKAYFELIQKRPNSKYVPYAYFGFGEIFLHEATQDPSKYDLAQQAYRECLKYPQSDIRPFAQRRIDALPTR